MDRQLTIWCNAEFPEAVTTDLKSAVGGHRLVFPSQRGSNLTAGAPSEELSTADIAFGQPDPEQVIASQSLKWVHLTSAGYTRYDRDDLKAALKARGAALTNSSSVYDEPCAQHMLAFMLAFARKLPRAFEEQLGQRRWGDELIRPQTRVLRGDNVLILGFGAIARRLIELLAPFNLKITAVRAHPRGDEPVPTYPTSELDSLLPEADHIVNVLPASPSTDGLLSKERLLSCKQGAIFYNVGRGTTVDQVGLLWALKGGQLGGAYLDVTEPEPYPPDHPLWTAPNCFITPHIAGGMADEHSWLVKHFLENLKRFEVGKPLRDRVV